MKAIGTLLKNINQTDKKEYANYIMEFNMADTDELKAGQRIIVPVIKYKEI